jgi:hypothetical protein
MLFWVIAVLEHVLKVGITARVNFGDGVFFAIDDEDNLLAFLGASVAFETSRYKTFLMRKNIDIMKLLHTIVIQP